MERAENGSRGVPNRGSSGLGAGRRKRGQPRMTMGSGVDQKKGGGKIEITKKRVTVTFPFPRRERRGNGS